MQPAGVSVITVWTCCNFLPHLNRGTLRSFLGKLNVCPWKGNYFFLVSVELLWDQGLCLPLSSSGLSYYHQVNILSRKNNHFISPQTLHASVFFMMRKVWEFKGGNIVNDIKISRILCLWFIAKSFKWIGYTVFLTGFWGFLTFRLVN